MLLFLILLLLVVLMVEEMTAGVSRVTYRNALAARYDHVIDGQYRLRVHSHPGHLEVGEVVDDAGKSCIASHWHRCVSYFLGKRRGLFGEGIVAIVGVDGHPGESQTAQAGKEPLAIHLQFKSVPKVFFFFLFSFFFQIAKTCKKKN